MQRILKCVGFKRLKFLNSYFQKTNVNNILYWYWISGLPIKILILFPLSSHFMISSSREGNRSTSPVILIILESLVHLHHRHQQQQQHPLERPRHCLTRYLPSDISSSQLWYALRSLGITEETFLKWNSFSAGSNGFKVQHC